MEKTIDQGVGAVGSLTQEGVQITDSIMSHMTGLIELAVPYLITFVSALAIFIIGRWVAKLMEKVVKAVLGKMKFDELVEKAGADKLKNMAGIQMSFSEIFAKIVFYIIYISVIIAVLEKFGLTVVTDAMKDLISYIPSVIVALIILILGTIVSNFIKDLIVKVGETGGLSYAKSLGNVAQTVAMVFIFMIAIQQLKIDISLIENNLTLLIGTLCVIAAVAGSFATKNIATNILASTYLKGSLAVGDTVQLWDISGEIVEITNTNVIVKTEKGMTHIPAEKMFNNIHVVK